ncbi:MAG: heme ABC transporter ATP-binding protein [Methanobacteriota archaeon]|nr:MAG: heme ABC transporter ATP-binding protein [Euryarchaeota archaeon]
MKLEVSNLSYSFYGRKVLREISFEIGEGEFLGLMGPNGSGKTTLLRCLTRYLPEATRAILVDMKPLHTLSDREVASTFAVVPQSSSTDFPFTVKDVVLMGRIPHIRSRIASTSRKDIEVVSAAMEVTGCASFADRPFSELSGGERQRVVIARALAQAPKALLLDEPTVYLDISGQLEMMDLVRRLNQEQSLTVLAVLHDINLAARYCDRIALLSQGSLEAIGPPEEVINSDTILNVYGVDVAVRKDPFTHDVFVMPRTVRSRASRDGMRVHVLCGGGSGGPVMRQLVDSGCSLSTGVLNVLDSDYECASDLQIPIVAEVPFAQISDEANDENLKRIDEASAVVVSRFPVGPGNFKNLEAAMYALDKGKRVMVMSGGGPPSIDFIGGKADAYIKRLVEAGATLVEDVEDLIRQLAGTEAVA